MKWTKHFSVAKAVTLCHAVTRFMPLCLTLICLCFCHICAAVHCWEKVRDQSLKYMHRHTSTTQFYGRVCVHCVWTCIFMWFLAFGFFFYLNFVAISLAFLIGVLDLNLILGTIIEAAYFCSMSTNLAKSTVLALCFMSSRLSFTQQEWRNFYWWRNVGTQKNGGTPSENSVWEHQRHIYPIQLLSFCSVSLCSFVFQPVADDWSSTLYI